MDPVAFAVLTNFIIVIGLISIFLACFTMLLIFLWPKKYFMGELILQLMLALILNITNGFVRLLQSDHSTSCVITAVVDHYSTLVVFSLVTVCCQDLVTTSINERHRRAIDRIPGTPR